MIDFSLLCKTLLILIFGVLSPGPDFFMVLRNSLTYGRKAGVLCALGIASGCFISFTLLIMGLKILLTYQFIKILLGIVCGLYLIYLGWKSLSHKLHHEKISSGKHKQLSQMVYYRNGLLTNILNPKLYTISAAILTYTEQQSPTLATNTAIILGNALIALAWFTTVSCILTNSKIRAVYFKREKILNIILGVILMLVGVRVMYG